MSFVFLQKFVKQRLNFRMSFILARFRQFVDVFIAIARGCTLQRTFRADAHTLLRVFLLARTAARGHQGQGRCEVCNSSEPLHKKVRKNRNRGIQRISNPSQDNVVTVRIFCSQKLLHNNLQKKSPRKRIKEYRANEGQERET